jgi:WD40 repeat protein
MDRTMKVWDAQTGQEVCSLSGHTGPVRGLAFCPDRPLLASVSQRPPEEHAAMSGEVKLWDTRIWREILSPGLVSGNPELVGVAFRSDGRRLASLEEHQIVVWDTATRTPIRTLLMDHNFIQTAVAFGPGGRVASSGVDGTVQLWDLSAREEVSPFAALVLPRPGLGRLLDAWQATTGLPTHVIAAHKSRAMAVAFSPDGVTLASAGLDGTIKFWDARTFQWLDTLRGHLGGIHSLAFRADGKRLASAGSDAVIRVWDVATRRPVLVLRGHTDAIYAVAFSADGRSLASGGWDKTVKIWDVGLEAESRHRAAAGPDD